ncbi:MAG: hypothetical protein AABZ10_10410, partial [Nitrospirota bacterium]
MRVLRRSAEIVTQHSGAPCAEAKWLTWVVTVFLKILSILLSRQKTPPSFQHEERQHPERGEEERAPQELR